MPFSRSPIDFCKWTAFAGLESRYNVSCRLLNSSRLNMTTEGSVSPVITRGLRVEITRETTLSMLPPMSFEFMVSMIPPALAIKILRALRRPSVWAAMCRGAFQECVFVFHYQGFYQNMVKLILSFLLIQFLEV